MGITTHDLVTESLKKNLEVTTQAIEDAKAQVKDTKQKEAAKITAIQQNGFYPFVKIEDNLVRYYPEGTSMGQVTGFVDGE